jgi:glycosyltransferase involved in cell wall biosynthesis
MKILYLSQYFPPEMGAPAARVFELSREWAALGHQVTVLTGFPNHPTGIIPPEYRGESFRRETVAGIEVIRVPIYAAANKGVLRRSANYVSYGLSSALLGPWVTEQPDVLIATSPQFLTAVSGLWLGLTKRCPFVFEVRDLWPRSIVEVGALKADNPGIRLLEQLELFLYQRADHIVTVTHSFVDEIAARGIRRDKMSVVTNGVDLEMFSPRPRDTALREELGLGDRFVALYVGTHGMAHGLQTMLDAARILRNDPRFAFVLVGEGADKATLKRMATEWQLDNVHFVDQQDRRRIPNFVAASDACLVLLKGKELFKTVIPSKMFEYMGVGRPIVIGVDGEARAIVEAAGAGLYVPPEDAAGLAAALVKLQEDPAACASMGQRGRDYAVAHYSRRALAERYLQVLEGLVSR